MSLPLTPSPPNETSTLLRCSFLAYTSPHTARGDSVEAGAEKPTGLCAAASYSQSTSEQSVFFFIISRRGEAVMCIAGERG